MTRIQTGGNPSIITNAIIWAILAAMLIFTLAPLLYMLTASAMPRNDILKMPYRWIPRGFHWQNFWKAIRGNDGSFIFLRNVLNSLIVATLVTITTVILSSLTGYGWANFSFRGRNLAFMMIMSTIMIPFEAIMIPLYLVATTLRIQNSYTGLVLPFLTNAFGIFMMRQYLLTFPEEFLDAASIDGASEFKIFWYMMIPNSIPAVATLAILTFRSQWDNLLWPLLIAQSEKIKTIPSYITKFATEKYTDEGAMMAVAVLASIPMLTIYASHKIGVAKPQAAFYEYILEQERCPPSQTIFIDDLSENVEAARRLGIRAFHFTGEVQLQEQLNLTA